MTPLQLAKHYFDLSNDSNFDEITPMFTDSSTFYSGKHDLFLGGTEIMSMQRAHHGSYQALHWHVTQVAEVKPGIIRFDFDFKGKTNAGGEVEYSGIEHVVIHQGKIQHIQIRLV